jgi:putative endonuclease
VPGAPADLRRGGELSTKEAGDRGEALAAWYLEQEGYSVVARNYRTRYGEVDVIARRGASLVFVEVKLRRGVGFGAPEESVTPRKQASIRRVAEQYLADESPEFEEVRFDVVGIMLRGRSARFRHTRNAF